MKKYLLRNARAQEINLFFEPEDKTALGYVGWIHSEMASGEEFIAVVHRGNKEMETEQYDRDIRDLVSFLKSNYSCPLMRSVEDTKRILALCPQDQCFGGDYSTDYGFVAHSDEYIFFIRVRFDEENMCAEFWVYGYNRDILIDAGIEPTDKTLL